MQKEEFFHRTELAKRLSQTLMSADGSSGLFITGPRRTGKSTFIREDFIPAIGGPQGSHIVYVDLWADQDANPGDAIVAVIRSELLKFDSFILRAAKGVGIDKIKVGGLEMSLNQVGFGQGETLTTALTMLAIASKKSVVLIIDEAQHTQVTEEGRKALFALKAARDAMNATNGPGFRLFATGSNSDKLVSLVEDKDQAFYQAPLIALPHLGDDYLVWLRERLPVDPRPSIDALKRAFTACNYRPEPLRAVLREIGLDFDLHPNEVDARFEAMMAASLTRTKSHFFQQVNGLNPLESAVLKTMASQGKNFAPYTKDAFSSYKAFILANTGEVAQDINQSSVQMALERLRSDKFIWRAGRGAYLIEDSQHLDWLGEALVQAQADVARARTELQARASKVVPTNF